MACKALSGAYVYLNRFSSDTVIMHINILSLAFSESFLGEIEKGSITALTVLFLVQILGSVERVRASALAKINRAELEITRSQVCEFFSRLLPTKRPTFGR
jgi:hypothetical protein